MDGMELRLVGIHGADGPADVEVKVAWRAP